MPVWNCPRNVGNFTFDLATLKVPPLRLAALWVFGGVSPDQSQWGLWGDLLDEPIGTRFEYPA